MIQERTIAQVVRDYRDRLTNSVYETLNGRTDAMSMRRAHRDMIFRLGPDAYIEGLREGGVPAEELDAADRKAITDWINEQYAHINGFADDTVAARGDDGKRKQIMSRLDMWVESMRTIGNQGLMSAQKNSMGTWRLGPTEEHCKTGNGRIGCANLHGKRHRLSWFLSRGLIPRQPGSAILGCKGYKCLCEIRGDDGSVLVPTTGRALRFDPNQPRDKEGKWTDTGIGEGESESNIPSVTFDDESKSATINNEIEIGGLEYDRVVKAKRYQAKYWKSNDGKQRRVYLNVSRNDITHQLHHGEWSSQQGKEWHGEGSLSFGYFDMDAQSKLWYHKQTNGVRINGKAFQQDYLIDTVKSLFNRHSMV